MAHFLLFPAIGHVLYPSTIHIHPSFHVSQLEPEDSNTLEGREQPPPPFIVDGKPEYLIERIIRQRN